MHISRDKMLVVVNNVRWIVKSLGYSLHDLGIRVNYLYDIEHGRTNMGMIFLNRLSQILKLDIYILMMERPEFTEENLPDHIRNKKRRIR